MYPEHLLLFAGCLVERLVQSRPILFSIFRVEYRLMRRLSNVIRPQGFHLPEY
jgi:hypothetical protein